MRFNRRRNEVEYTKFDVVVVLICSFGLVYMFLQILRWVF